MQPHSSTSLLLNLDHAPDRMFLLIFAVDTGIVVRALQVNGELTP